MNGPNARDGSLQIPPAVHRDSPKTSLLLGQRLAALGHEDLEQVALRENACHCDLVSSLVSVSQVSASAIMTS